MSGWQKQNHRHLLELGNDLTKHRHVTVQSLLESAFTCFQGAPVVVQGSSRTDAGVSARAQVAHVDLHRPNATQGYHPSTVYNGVNYYLNRICREARRSPKASWAPYWCDVPIVHVTNVEEAPAFHARWHAKARLYRYTLIVPTSPSLALPASSVFDGHTAWLVRAPKGVHLPSIQQSLQPLIGQHDFSSFRAVGCQAPTPIRHIHTITTDTLPIDASHARVEITIQGNAFLYHMVRNMVGFAVFASDLRHSSRLPSAQEILAERDCTLLSRLKIPRAPPHGLVLERVIYPEDYLEMVAERAGQSQ